MLGQVPNRSSADSLNAGAWIRRTLELAVEDGDDSWPLLFPMTKCVIRAMDAVTEFCAEMLGRKAGGFVVGGAAEHVLDSEFHILHVVIMRYGSLPPKDSL